MSELSLTISGNTTKIPQDAILSEGKYPVITQENDKLISGYTNNEECITDYPLIVFGDHSCTYKYVDFDFVRGADGTQLIKIDETKVLTKFAYHYLRTITLTNAEKYERHFKYLKEITIPILSKEGQQRIITEIEGYESAIAQARAVMEGCAARKQAILDKYLK